MRLVAENVEKIPYFIASSALLADAKGSTFSPGVGPTGGPLHHNERIHEMVKNNKPARTTEMKPRTKSQIYSDIAESTSLSRKQVAGVFEAMGGLIKKDLGTRGPGIFTVPGLMKIKRVHKPAVKAREGKNPFTGEMMMFKAKPARNVVKVLALKGLKEMV